MTVGHYPDTQTLSWGEALSALESARAENVRLRRTLLDLLYNLDEENMPSVAARIKAAEDTLTRESAGLALLLSNDEEGNPHIRAEALVEALASLSVLSLSHLSLSLLAMASEDGKQTLAAEPSGLSVQKIQAGGSREYESESVLSPASLSMKLEQAGGIAGGDTLTLSPHGLCIPYVRRKFKTSKSGLYPLYIDEGGNIVAATT